MKQYIVANEQGFIVVWALLLLVVVTLLGSSGISTSIFETKMAANKALHQKCFYQADGGTENGLGILKHNITCVSGFSDSSLDGTIEITSTSLNLWMSNSNLNGIDLPTDAVRDFYYPKDYAAGDPHTNGSINGVTKLVTGATINMMAGYEGKAKSLGADGAFLLYDIKVVDQGVRNAKSNICISYRVDNQFANNPAGNCIY